MKVVCSRPHMGVAPRGLHGWRKRVLGMQRAWRMHVCGSVCVRSAACVEDAWAGAEAARGA